MTRNPDPAADRDGDDGLELADWRRRVATLYAEVRFLYRDDPIAAWRHWREGRAELFRTHPSSPVPAPERAAFQPRHWAYDPRYASEPLLEPDSPSDHGLDEPGLRLPNSGSDSLEFRRIGTIRPAVPGGFVRLSVFWMAGYVGGLFIPFRDETNGRQTYGAGRYLIDTAKSADLGGDPARGAIVCDFNFSYQPSCAFDPRWACPLAPAENRLDLAIEAGERIA